jgi:hypothetical protein
MTPGSTVDLAAYILINCMEIPRRQTKSVRTVCHMIVCMHISWRTGFH